LPMMATHAQELFEGPISGAEIAWFLI